MQTSSFILREFQIEDAIHLFEMPENVASIKFLEKIGMTYNEIYTKNGVEWLILSIKNNHLSIINP